MKARIPRAALLLSITLAALATASPTFATKPQVGSRHPSTQGMIRDEVRSGPEIVHGRPFHT